MNRRISESIFDGRTTIIPMADVQHIEKHFSSCDLVNGTKKGDIDGYIIVTKNTSWDKETDFWANNIYLPKEEGENFLQAWCIYRHEFEEIELPKETP